MHTKSLQWALLDCSYIDQLNAGGYVDQLNAGGYVDQQQSAGGYQQGGYMADASQGQESFKVLETGDFVFTKQ
jgi:hypothetical protein